MGGAVELKMSRPAIERNLKQQLFNGPQGRYCLKGNEKSAYLMYAEKPALSFAGGRMVVRVEIHAGLERAPIG